MIDEILKEVGGVKVPGFFVTVEFVETSIEIPAGIKDFILKKYKSIKEGAKGRKFSFQSDGWRMHFTFFPTDSVVDPKYAMMNKLGIIRKCPLIQKKT